MKKRIYVWFVRSAEAFAEGCTSLELGRVLARPGSAIKPQWLIWKGSKSCATWTRLVNQILGAIPCVRYSTLQHSVQTSLRRRRRTA